VPVGRFGFVAEQGLGRKFLQPVGAGDVLPGAQQQPPHGVTQPEGQRLAEAQVLR
jgi:hypothetical protein